MIVGEIECKVWPKGKVFTVKQNLLACLLGVPVQFDRQVLDMLKHNQGAIISEPSVEEIRKRMGIKPLPKQERTLTLNETGLKKLKEKQGFEK